MAHEGTHSSSAGAKPITAGVWQVNKAPFIGFLLIGLGFHQNSVAKFLEENEKNQSIGLAPFLLMRFVLSKKYTHATT